MKINYELDEQYFEDGKIYDSNDSDREKFICFSYPGYNVLISLDLGCFDVNPFKHNYTLCGKATDDLRGFRGLVRNLLEFDLKTELEDKT